MLKIGNVDKALNF